MYGANDERDSAHTEKKQSDTEQKLCCRHRFYIRRRTERERIFFIVQCYFFSIKEVPAVKKQLTFGKHVIVPKNMS